MADARYDLVFEGELLEGFDPQQVRARFSEIFKVSEDKLERVFAGTRVVLRRKLSQEHARRFHDILSKLGMKVHMRAIATDDPEVIGAAAGIGAPVAGAADVADAAQAKTLPFEFHGRGGEYFKIWIVNIFLTIVTLGIYSAWAKVRNNRYFYGNTRLAGHSFEYLAEPMTILKGRLLAMGCFALYMLAEAFIPWLAAILLLVFLVALPWIVVKSLTFNARNSAYRNVRFDFRGTTGQAFGAFFGWPLLGMLTLGLLFPYAYYKQQQFIVANSAYGQQPFDFDARPKQYYMIFLAALAMVVTAVAAVTVLSMTMVSAAGGSGMVLAPFAMVLAYLMAGAYIYVRVANLRLNGALLEAHRFRSEMKVWGYAWIWSSNAVAIVLTLGLLYPWARVRIARYRASCTRMLPAGDLDAFANAQERKVSAAGQEIGDVFDVGIGI